MPSFEEISHRIITDKRFANKLLIGGLISFVPILNIVILGYFQGYARQIRDSGNLSLPSLDKWWIRLGTLFLDGLLLLALLAAYSLAGGIFGWGLYQLLKLFFLSLFSPIINSYAFELFRLLPVGLPLLLAPPCSVASLYLYQARNNYQDILRLDAVMRMLCAGWKSLLFPCFFFVGLMVVGAPLYGFAFFLGFSCILAYLTILFGVLENERKASST